MSLRLPVRRSVCMFLVLVVSMGFGCHHRGERSKPDSEFEWRNETSDKIWIDSAAGFDIDPTPGILPGPARESGAGLVLPHQNFPPETTITWWYGDREAKENAEIRNSTVAIPARPAGEGRKVLVLTLRENLDWDLHWEPARY